MTRNDLLEAELRKLLAARIEALRDGLELPVSDSMMHNFAAGRVSALREAGELIDEAKTNINKRET